MRDVRPTRQCAAAVRGSVYRSGRSLPLGFLVEVDEPRQQGTAMPVDHEGDDADDASETGASAEAVTREDRPRARTSAQIRVGSNGLDPLTNALGYWNWMIDHGYNPSTGEFPTRVS